MEEEKIAAEERRKSRMKLVAIMAVLIVLGIALYAAPILLYPDNVVHDDSLSNANSHTTDATLTIDKGTYEVWMTTSFWTLFMLDQPIVNVNRSGGQPVSVDYTFGGDDRNIDGDGCRHFATFIIREKAEYNVSITAGVMSLGVPGSERVYIIEERPSTYAPMQWAGILVSLLGVLAVILLLVLMAMASSDEKDIKKKQGQVPVQGAYPPPPGYAPYPQQQQPPPYPQPYPPPYPPHQQQYQPPPYPQQQQQPQQQPQYQQPPYPQQQQQQYQQPYQPPQGQPPAYESQPQPPAPRKGRSKY